MTEEAEPNHLTRRNHLTEEAEPNHLTRRNHLTEETEPNHLARQNHLTELTHLLRASGAVKFGDFTLTSGRKSTYYVDVKNASTRPHILALMARMMAPYISGEDLLAGMELGAVPIVAALALESGIPYVIIRKGERGHGTGRRIEGACTPGQRVLLVEDVATTGGSMLRSAEILRGAGLVVHRALVVVDREEGAAGALLASGIELIPLVRIGQMMGTMGLNPENGAPSSD